MKSNKHIKFMLFGLSMGLTAIQGSALSSPATDNQADYLKTRVVDGSISDAASKPIVGAVVSVPGSTVEAVTDANGHYSIDVPRTVNSLEVSCVGYRTMTSDIYADENNNYILTSDGHGQNVVLTLAQGLTTTEEALTGAVSSVKGQQLLKTPSAGTTQRLAGHLAGLGFINSTSDLNSDGGTFFIRGRRTLNGNDPLIVINGVPSPTTDVNSIDVNSIEDIVLLKDASATALYGQQAANGALLINTRQGFQGRTKINVKAEFAVQNATVLPTVMDSWQYATLRDHALINDGLTPVFTQEQIDEYRLGTNPLYPNNRWYDMYTHDQASMQRYNINVSGGNQRVLYFINGSYMHQGSLLKTEKQERYDPHFYLNRFNVTSNLKVNIFKNLSAALNTNVIIDNQNQPNHDDFYGTLLRTPASEFGPFTSELTDEAGEIITPSGGIVASDYLMDPIHGRLNKNGSRNTTRTAINVALNLDWGLDFITRGLSLKGLLGYESRYSETTTGSADYQRYVYDEAASLTAGYPVFTTFGDHVNTPLSMGKSSDMLYYLNFMGSLAYDRTFNKTHSVEALLSYFYQDYEKQNFDADGMLPYTRTNYSLHAKYGFKQRYYLQFDGAYSGSDAFCTAPGKTKYGFFPAVSGSWVLSNEQFYGNLPVAKWFTLAKIRASYGVNGNDIIAGGRRYLYMDQYTVGGGGYLGQVPYYGAMASEGLQGNPALTWEKVYKQNYGVDLGFFNALTIHFDYFREKTNDMVVQSTLFPDFSGTDRNNLPYINFGKVENHGFDYDVEYFKRVNSDFSFSVGARGGYARNKVIASGELDRTASGYAYGLRTDGFSIGQNWGYLIDMSNGNGYYNSKAEIASGPLFEGQQPRIGDFKYVDLNEDGIINDKDIAPIGGTDIPTFNYGIDASLKWRDFDFYVLFQGATGRSVYTSGLGAMEVDNRGSFTDIHLKAYTEDRYANGMEISYPALTTNSSSTSLRANSFFITDRDYCRLKNIEIGYSLPQSIVKKAYMSEVRFFAQAMNLFTIGSHKFKDIDIEAYNCAAYPIYRTFNFGVQVSF